MEARFDPFDAAFDRPPVEVADDLRHACRLGALAEIPVEASVNRPAVQNEGFAGRRSELHGVGSSWSNRQAGCRRQPTPPTDPRTTIHAACCVGRGGDVRAGAYLDGGAEVSVGVDTADDARTPQASRTSTRPGGASNIVASLGRRNSGGREYSRSIGWFAGCGQVEGTGRERRKSHAGSGQGTNYPLGGTTG